MLRSLSAWFYRIASWKTFLLGLVLYIPFPAYFFKNLEAQMNAFAGKAIGPIDLLMFEFNPQKILQMVADYGPEGRAIYAQGEMTLDIVYPFIYTFLFSVILSLLYRNKSYAPFLLVNIVPVFFIFFDFLENACIIYLLNTYPDASLSVATLCSILSNIKWAGLVIELGLAVYGLIRLLLQAVTPQPAH